MRSSSLKHKVIFREKTQATDTLGGPIDNAYADIQSPDEWVQIIPMKGEERYVGKSLKTEVDHKIRMRYRSGLDSKMIIMFGKRRFDIDSIIDPYERHRELHLMCTEVSGD